jgi:hypothetical protein
MLLLVFLVQFLKSLILYDELCTRYSWRNSIVECKACKFNHNDFEDLES